VSAIFQPFLAKAQSKPKGQKRKEIIKNAENIPKLQKSSREQLITMMLGKIKLVLENESSLEEKEADAILTEIKILLKDILNFKLTSKYAIKKRLKRIYRKLSGDLKNVIRKYYNLFYRGDLFLEAEKEVKVIQKVLSLLILNHGSSDTDAAVFRKKLEKLLNCDNSKNNIVDFENTCNMLEKMRIQDLIASKQFQEAFLNDLSKGFPDNPRKK
jgi:hypothetical protein